MSRLPPKPRDQLSPEEAEVHDTFRTIATQAFKANGEMFEWEDSNGGLLGPFPFYIAAPACGNALHDLLRGLAKLPVPANAREVVIMALGGKYQAGYVTYSHISQGMQAGLTREQVETMRKDGSRPAGLDDNCNVAYDIAEYLATKKGPLPQQLWDKSVAAFGKDGTLGLLHYIGFYSYVCVALNGVDAPVPE